MLHADTVVIGSGPAGCAIAGRLAERGEEVLLVEAGPDYGPRHSGGWPSDLLEAHDLAESHSWHYDSGQQYPDRVIPFQRARVIGGCSSHNGCAAIWGHRADYDGWAARGNDGWSTDELLPFFRSASTQMRVQIPRPEAVTPFHRAFLEAAPGSGIAIVDDLNDLDENTGMAPSPANIVGGVRWNAAFAYLDPQRGVGNFRILGNAMVDRLQIDDRKVTGVIIVVDGGREIINCARVVVSGGTYGSPAILQRSGIGDPETLRAAGIRPIHDLPGVGRNLHDHPAVVLRFTGTDEIKARMTHFMKDHWLPEEQTIAKLRSSKCTEAFDIHLYPEGGPYAEQRTDWIFCVPVACMTPKSRGELRITSADPEARPHIEHRYLSDPEHHDRDVLVDAVAIARELTGQPALKALLGTETAPSASIVGDAAVAAWVERSVVHYYHAVGTCKMGPASDAGAVVDARGMVHGLDGLYVGDCSIMPVIPRANTNIPACVVGERIASML